VNAALGLGLFALALAVGTYGSIIGAGGGFIMVAALVLFFDLSGAEAVGTSVMTILFVQLSGALTYDRAGMIDRPTARWFATGSVPMAFAAAALVANRIPQRTFDLLIGSMLLALGAWVIFGRTSEESTWQPSEPQKVQLIGAGSMVGAIGGAFGVGGGLVTVPLLRSLQKLPTKRATATTTAIGAASGVAGAVGHTLADNPKWSYVPFVIAGAILGGRLGSSSADRLSQQTVAWLLAVGLLASGAPLLLRGI
jgi:uncharacterized membrane protein YfcA